MSIYLLQLKYNIKVFSFFNLGETKIPVINKTSTPNTRPFERQRPGHPLLQSNVEM